MGASPPGVDGVSQVGGRGQDDTGIRHSLPGELFISPRSTREQHYGWLAATNKWVKAFSTWATTDQKRNGVRGGRTCGRG